MKYFLLNIFFLLSTLIVAQNNNMKKPWVEGRLPKSIKNTNYKIIFSEADNISRAFDVSEEKIITSIFNSKGVSLSLSAVQNIIKNQTFSQKNKSGNFSFSRKNNESNNKRKTIHFKYKDQKIAFSKVDHYYEYKNGTYHLWVLYLVSEDGKKIGNVPTLAYKVNNGAYRSLLVPGWAQFYTKQPVKGSLFLAGEAALIGGGFYLYNRFQHNDTRANEANSVKIKQEYRKRAKNYKTYSYIAFGAAAGLYIYNVVDAFTSKRGKMTYDYKNMRLAVTPSVGLTEDYYATVGFTIHF